MKATVTEVGRFVAVDQHMRPKMIRCMQEFIYGEKDQAPRAGEKYFSTGFDRVTVTKWEGDEPVEMHFYSMGEFFDLRRKPGDRHDTAASREAVWKPGCMEMPYFEAVDKSVVGDENWKYVQEVARSNEAHPPSLISVTKYYRMLLEVIERLSEHYVMARDVCRPELDTYDFDHCSYDGTEPESRERPELERYD